ncbi:unnamed protein product [Soboliphyme baturini]|uniref:Midasin n=1 Tax=Soboliphyme baturini TaxID=241478 RepID=A0A183IN79_9BILA|nr:unnamed protein product [Soboliphyme baturini]
MQTAVQRMDSDTMAVRSSDSTYQDLHIIYRNSRTDEQKRRLLLLLGSLASKFGETDVQKVCRRFFKEQDINKLLGFIERTPDEVSTFADCIKCQILLLRHLSPCRVDGGNLTMHRVSAVVDDECEYVDEGFVQQLLTTATTLAKPLLIVGPVGSGKSAVVVKYARTNGRTTADTFSVIHFGENMDGKALFGYYHCTEVPGEFQWKFGLITEAMVNGKWLLLEDVDHAPSDVLGYLASVLETRAVKIAGRRTITASPDFQLFATARTDCGASRLNAEVSLVLRKFPMFLSLKSFTVTRMRKMILDKYPRLSKLTDCMLEIFHSLIDVTRSAHHRMISFRDLSKWCHRVSYFECFNDAVGIFQNAVDCLVAHMRDPQARLDHMMRVGVRMNMNKEQVTYYFEKYKPRVDADSNRITVGRVRIDCLRSMSVDTRSAVFAFSRPACTLLEQIALCTELDEPVLLVGDTGCGKTTTVQFLAEYVGRKLSVINMNQQSELTDLIGGYKPADLRASFMRLKQLFTVQFSKTFSTTKNERFLKHVQTCFVNAKWQELIGLIRYTASKAIEKNDSSASHWQLLLQEIPKYQTLVDRCREGVMFSYVEV